MPANRKSPPKTKPEVQSLDCRYGKIGIPAVAAAMRDGNVTATWAKHHHLRWYEAIVAGRAREKIVQPGTNAPAQPANRQKTA